MIRVKPLQWTRVYEYFDYNQFLLELLNNDILVYYIYIYIYIY
jgi:hypothetical protein